jgi:type IV pilus assembly protein PilF
MTDKDWNWSFTVTLLCATIYFALFAGISGCSSPSGQSASPIETYTASDEPENRKRASNRLRLAVLYFQDGKNTIALDEVKQAITADPNWFEAYNMRGLIYMRSNDYPLADASFAKALSINPASAEVRHNYGVLLCKQNRNAEAYKMFAMALATPGYLQRSNTFMEQGVCQLNAGQKDDAEASFTKSYEVDPANPVSGYNIGLLKFGRGEVAKAQFYIRRINNGDFATADSLWLGVKIEKKIGNSDAASQLGAQLIKRYPKSSQAAAYERGAFDE